MSSFLKTRGFSSDLERRAPALFLGLNLTLAFLVGLGQYAAIPPLILLLLLSHKRAIGATLALLAALWGHFFFSFPEKMAGSFDIALEHIHENPFGFSYKAKIQRFQEKGGAARRTNLHCRLFSKERYSASATYRIEGRLESRGAFRFLKTNEKWQPLSPTFNLVELRYRAKKNLDGLIQKEATGHPEAALLLSSLTTGELDDPWLKTLFQKSGLSHLLAISGFHFALIACLLHFLFAPLLPSRVEALLIIFLMTLYFCFLGASPSVMRAWIAMVIFLGAKMVQRPSSAPNSLGVALLVAFFIDPLSSQELGFQLSFLATGALLFLAPKIGRALEELTRERSGWLEKSFALNSAVHLAVAPLLISTFHSLYLHSFLYNLIFPLLFIPVFLGLALSLPLFWILPCLGPPTLKAIALYSQSLIDLLAWQPFPHKTLYIAPFSPWLISAYFSLLLLFVLWKNEDYRTMRYTDF